MLSLFKIIFNQSRKRLDLTHNIVIELNSCGYNKISCSCGLNKLVEGNAETRYYAYKHVKDLAHVLIIKKDGVICNSDNKAVSGRLGGAHYAVNQTR